MSGSGINGAATANSSVLSLGASVSSVNDPATPSAAGASKKSNWEVIEHYHKSGLHGPSSSTRQIQQVSRPLEYFLHF